MKYKYLFGAFFILAAELILLKYDAPAWVDLVFGAFVFMIWILYKIIELFNRSVESERYYRDQHDQRTIAALTLANNNQAATSMAALHVAAIQTTEAGLARALANGGQWVKVGGEWHLQLKSGRTGPVEIVEPE